MNKNITRKPMGLENEIQTFKKFCRKYGWKITPQRVAIYEELVASQKHPSASMIYQRIKTYFPNISLGTVNSTLLAFARKGLAKVVESSGDPKRFDPNLRPHHHFRCTKCGRIIDFLDDTYDALKIPGAIKKKFMVSQKTVLLEGLCEKCRVLINK
jgi:Fur family peroxide stress response transcriptional regulator